MVLTNGYSLEEHFLETEDGYILRLFRIGSEIQLPGDPPGGGKPVVFLHHPLMGSSIDFVAMGPNRSLAFILADAGNSYDVWLANVRGNRFSRNHSRLDPDAPSDVASFWSFSWDEHASLDLPASLDLVAQVTGQDTDMLFVGYSQAR
ncbi:hypothetical protein VOLCADRAFT_57003 [Volvox carteri f. nagariensis]|uniref:Partial AB-hydrolase lipase domain-containing protein n=1 Tax=Volvox carteri f. nagariensis TaxID=3068 RepID=D8TLQ3_VOLCA|nr:uncharacterized protein VOLCADRAFT_57003 [Volvox carteri f. nagariensis]EFJ51507.1 hypothetical protein VOLCADRAFT_57003 [Volvox carteri f. nagariensis]|eukprot:XP_002947459.1 hypothetical protein VOLCADRAFT_57003 [Volvox carteri f. nagariensis]